MRKVYRNYNHGFGGAQTICVLLRRCVRNRFFFCNLSCNMIDGPFRVAMVVIPYVQRLTENFKNLQERQRQCLHETLSQGNLVTLRVCQYNLKTRKTFAKPAVLFTRFFANDAINYLSVKLGDLSVLERTSKGCLESGGENIHESHP